MATITQYELQRYQGLKAQADQARRQLDGLRQALLARLEAGEQVEAGPLTAQVRIVTRRELNGPKLVTLLGEAAVVALKGQVEPTVQRQLIIQATPACPALEI